MAQSRQLGVKEFESISTIDQLKHYVDQIEALEEEAQSVREGIKSLYQQAKRDGLNALAIKAVIKARKIDRDAREEREVVFHEYAEMLGVLRPLKELL